MGKEQVRGFWRELPKENPLTKGRNYLLLIGIDTYEHISPLKNAVKDVEDFRELVCERYHFEAKDAVVLLNEEATREHIIEAFDRLVDIVTENDKLVIYFAGHGTLDKRERGYWIPVDARPNRSAQLVYNTRIRDYIADIPSRHTLLIVDSCFSGAMMRESDAEVFSKRVEGLPSRWILTSGRNEVVSDGRAGSNSPFAASLLTYLRQNQAASLPVSSLVQHVKLATPRNAKQTPYGSYMHGVGDQHGEMIFHLRKVDPEGTAWKAAKADNNTRAYSQFLRKYPQSTHRQKALKRINELSKKAQTRVKFSSLGLPVTEMIRVKGGSFLMGDEKGEAKDALHIHEVHLEDFYIGKYPVTVAQYRAYCKAAGLSMPEAPAWGWKDEHPMVEINWREATAYCKWLSQQMGDNYRLPTEAEWEYAARGGVESQGYLYAGANEADKVGWYWKNAGDQLLSGVWNFKKLTENKGRTHRVGQKQANELGVYDMSGNVWEWCADGYAEDFYHKSPQHNPASNSSNNLCVLRGGSWYFYDLLLRVAIRYKSKLNFQDYDIGFRIARALT